MPTLIPFNSDPKAMEAKMKAEDALRIRVYCAVGVALLIAIVVGLYYWGPPMPKF